MDNLVKRFIKQSKYDGAFPFYRCYLLDAPVVDHLLPNIIEKLVEASPETKFEFVINCWSPVKYSTTLGLLDALLQTPATTVSKVLYAQGGLALAALSCSEIRMTPFSSMIFQSFLSPAGAGASEVERKKHFQEIASGVFGLVCAGFLTVEEINDIVYKRKSIFLSAGEVKERLNQRGGVKCQE